MALILSYILLAEGIICLMQASAALRENIRRYRENQIFALTAICSAGWSICFGLLIVQTNYEIAYYCRCVGLAFTFLYLALGMTLVGWWTKLKRRTRRIVTAIASTGLLVFPFIIGRDDMSFTLTEYGMAYSMSVGVGNNLYMVYCVVVSVLSFAMIFAYLFRARRRRDRILTYQMLASQLVLVFGMIFDTVFPLLGIQSFPGSSIAQGITAMILFSILRYTNDLGVSMEKMGGYVHELVDMPILLFDDQGMLKIWNKATGDFLGSDIVELCGEEGIISRISQIFDMQEPAFDRRERKIEIETQCLCKDAICRVDATGIFDKYGDLLGYIAVVTDLTAERQTMRELDEAKRNAEEANAAKSRFLANMSHEIRTPMHAIIGFSELILRMPADREIRGYVEDIRLASNNLLGIINDILDISKLEAGKMEIVEVDYNLSALLKDLCVVIDPEARKKGLEFRIETTGEIYERMHGDKLHIREILLNILNNAVKYTKKGKVIFRIRQEVVDERTVTLIFETEDTGVGIKEEDKENLFTAFAQVDKKVHYGEEGSGLGLAITNDYVRLMGGCLELESEYGKGSLFRVKLPQRYEEGEWFKESDIQRKVSREETARSRFTLTDQRVLVVDDNKVNLRVAKGILKTYGVEADVADSGLAAIELCRQKQYQLIFMDQMMPVMDGVETMKHIRECDGYYRENGRIVALTANVLVQEKERLLAEGFDGYLSKPMEVDKLEGLLTELVPAEKIHWEVQGRLDEAEAEDDEVSVQRLVQALPGVDVKEGIDNCGQVQTYMEVLEIVLNHGREQIEQLRSLQEQKNYTDYTIRVHALKSTAANIGATEIAEMAKRQEMMGKQGDYEEIDGSMQIMLEKYEVLLGYIGDLLGRQEIQGSEEITKQQTEHVKEELLRLTYEFDFERMEKILNEMEHYRLDVPDRQLFDDVKRLLNNLEVEEIRDRLTKR